MPAGGTAKRWSRAEDDALLRAWADAATWHLQNLPEAFEAACAAASLPHERSIKALQLRCGLFARMHETVCAFHRQYPVGDGGGGIDASQNAATHASASAITTTEYSSDSWFELGEPEQRRWHASLNTKSYLFGEMTRETFEHVDAICKSKLSSSRGASERSALYNKAVSRQGERCKKYTVAGGNPLAILKSDLRATIARLKAAGAAAADETVVGNERHADLNEEDDPGGGSSTDSDDEFLTMWDEKGDAVPQSGSIGKAEIELKSKMDGVQFAEQQLSSHQEDNKVDPDFLELASILETQSRHLSNLFRQTKQRRYEESRGRQYIWKKTRLDDSDKNQVLQDIARRNQELQREREDRNQERRKIKQELMRLRERKAARPPPREASDSGDSEQ